MKRFSIAIPVLAALLMGGAAQAATTSETQSVQVTVATRLKITLGTASIAFPDSDPDSGAVAAAAFSINAKARVSAASNVTLSVAGPDLATSIPVSQLSMAITGDAGYVAAPGALNTTGVSLGSWTGSGNRAGSVVLSFTPEWDDVVGTSNTTLTYTLAST